MTSKERYEVCKKCPWFRKSIAQCKKCMCFMKLKTKIKSASCPIGNW